MIGPLEPELPARAHIIPFGVIYKSHTGKWHLIVNLSSPAGSSVDDGINPSLYSLTYITVDMVVEKWHSWGEGQT